MYPCDINDVNIINKSQMGGCYSGMNSSFMVKNKKELQKIQMIDLKPLLQKLRAKYVCYRKEHLQNSDNSDLILLQQQVRNIYMGLIKEKIMQANQNKITMKQCKIELSQEMLEVQIFILKYVQNLNIDSKDIDVIKQFFQLANDFLVTLARFLKTMYPRGENVEAGQLAKLFKQYDYTELYQYDILKNAGFVFSSVDEFDITNNIKLFLNEIMRELDAKFGDFYKMIQGVDPTFKIGRKISENTSKYLKLDTGTIQIKSTQVARVLIKWMQDLTQMLSKSDQKISTKNQYKFYKKLVQQNKIEFSKCQQLSFGKILNNGLIYNLKENRNQYNQKTKVRKSKFRKFNMNLVKIFNEVTHNQSEVSRQFMQVIKYSSFNNSFITWMVEQQLIQSIKCLVWVGKQHEQFRGVLDLIKFKINDLMRCQIFGNRNKIKQVFQKLKRLQQEEKLEIIKIKNRFSTPMSDAMLFFKLPNSFIICECQLILSQQNKGQGAKKAKNIQTLNHFLYELQRSPFGVLGQIAVFLTAKSQSVGSYCDAIKLSLKDAKKTDLCIKQHKQQIKQDKKRYKQQRSPFLCVKCIKFYPKFSNKIAIHNCIKCMITLCNACMGQKFEITDQMIKTSLTKRLQLCKAEMKKTKHYRLAPSSYDQGLQSTTSQYILQNAFQKKKITEIPYIKETFKNNRVKAESIIQYINSKQDYVKVYIQKGLKVNFVIITWRGNSARFKCYRYDHDQRNIVNVFQEIQKYENHQFIQMNEFDLFVEFIQGGICKFNEKNARKDGFEFRCRSNLERGFYVFEGQSKEKTIELYNQIAQIQRDKYLLISYEMQHEFYLIIDIDESLKRSLKTDKMKQHLKIISKTSIQKKDIKMTDMNINNSSFINFNDHLNWIKSIKSLNLSDNNISDISPVFKLCHKLQKLNISNNRFTELNFIQKMPRLTEINGSENNINKVINLVNVRRIQSLNLQSNQIDSLMHYQDNNVMLADFIGQKDVSPFQRIINFFTLNKSCQENFIIQADQVLNVKDEHKCFIYFRKLNLANNQFIDITQFTEGYFPNLTYLNLSDNLIKTVPLLELDKLQEIHLSNNCIQSIEKFAKGDNSNLNQFSIKSNRLKQIPKLNFPNLLKVDISYNLLQKIQHFVTGEYFQNLTNLYLSNINISALPNLTKSIRVFGFENSQLNDSDIQHIISQLQLPRLRELYLSRNKATKLPRIENLFHLRSLFLEQNPIDDISILQREQQAQTLLLTSKLTESTIMKKGSKLNSKEQNQDKQDIPGKQQKKVKQYRNLQRLWLSLQLKSHQQFKEAKQRIQKLLQFTKLVCWKYDSMFIIKIPMRKFYLHSQKYTQYKYLITKRIYLMNVFEHETQINNRFQLIGDTLWYNLEHQWNNIDMDEFVKYDWNEIDSIDLRGTGLDDNKWDVFVNNAYLFPNLKEIHLWDNKVKTVKQGDLDNFKVLEKIDFYQNGWTNPLSQETKTYLRKFRSLHPKIVIDFEE